MAFTYVPGPSATAALVSSIHDAFLRGKAIAEEKRRQEDEANGLFGTQLGAGLGSAAGAIIGGILTAPVGGIGAFAGASIGAGIGRAAGAGIGSAIAGGGGPQTRAALGQALSQGATQAGSAFAGHIIERSELDTKIQADFPGMTLALVEQSAKNGIFPGQQGGPIAPGQQGGLALPDDTISGAAPLGRQRKSSGIAPAPPGREPMSLNGMLGLMYEQKGIEDRDREFAEQEGRELQKAQRISQLTGNIAWAEKNGMNALAGNLRRAMQDAEEMRKNPVLTDEQKAPHIARFNRILKEGNEEINQARKAQEQELQKENSFEGYSETKVGPTRSDGSQTYLKLSSNGTPIGLGTTAPVKEEDGGTSTEARTKQLIEEKGYVPEIARRIAKAQDAIDQYAEQQQAVQQQMEQGGPPQDIGPPPPSIADVKADIVKQRYPESNYQRGGVREGFVLRGYGRLDDDTWYNFEESDPDKAQIELRRSTATTARDAAREGGLFPIAGRDAFFDVEKNKITEFSPLPPTDEDIRVGVEGFMKQKNADATALYKAEKQFGNPPTPKLLTFPEALPMYLANMESVRRARQQPATTEVERATARYHEIAKRFDEGDVTPAEAEALDRELEELKAVLLNAPG